MILVEVPVFQETAVGTIHPVPEIPVEAAAAVVAAVAAVEINLKRKQ